MTPHSTADRYHIIMERLVRAVHESRIIHEPKFWNLQYLGSEIIASIFRSIIESNNLPKIRIDLKGHPRPDLIDKLMRSPLLVGEDFDGWAVRTLGAENYCLALDGLTRWSETFHRQMHEHFLAPLISKLGEPLLGGTFYAFTGKYGYTPAGIHIDGDPTFLIHLGPHNKEAWIWPDGCKPSKNGPIEESFDLDAINPEAIHYVLNPGDLLYIPPRSYHLLKSTDFSSTIGFSFFSGSNTDVIARGLVSIDELEAPERPERSITWPMSESIDNQCRICLQSVFGYELSNIGTKLLDGLVRERARLKSNGFVTATPSREQVDPAKMQRSVFRLPQWIQFSYQVKPPYLEIYSRGRILILESQKALIDCLEYIISRDHFNYGDFHHSVGHFLSKEAADDLLRVLVEVRAIEMLGD